MTIRCFNSWTFLIALDQFFRKQCCLLILYFHSIPFLSLVRLTHIVLLCSFIFNYLWTLLICAFVHNTCCILYTSMMWFLRHALPVFTGLGRCPIVSWDFAGAVSIFGPDALPVVHQWLLPGLESTTSRVRVAAHNH